MSDQSRDTLASDEILARLTALHPKIIDLSLGRIERLLASLGNPQRRLPPVIHVAGTNGKGSTCAFLRAMLEASGKRVHVYSSPHLVHFHERIRLSGKLIDEDELSALLEECEQVNAGEQITFFEITTAAALLAFTRHKADAVILEVGLGGIHDATNVIERPAATIITPVDLDHQHYLGPTIEKIAGEKAGIMKRGIPCIMGPQSDEGREVIEARAQALNVALSIWGQDFMAHEEHKRMVYQDEDGLIDLPLPRLPGAHQIVNAATAIAALRKIPAFKLEDTAFEDGLITVDWPGRMQRLTRGPLVSAAPKGAEIWLDGAHNPHGARALAHALADLEDRNPRPLYMICGMLQTKDARGYLATFRGLAKHVTTVAIPGDAKSQGAGQLYDAAREEGLEAHPAPSIEDAMLQIEARAQLAGKKNPPRIVICGSLHLAGAVLRENG
ncbi:MAG: bifunctional folylpolyglutamate synthase/dihydrofolate synthase [Alphaproteobacteria bacterium]|nr:bifunctional folylpolyglutamate synthase/dihydrofolate synthase [Alphaproteobacteria bacterium]